MDNDFPAGWVKPQRKRTAAEVRDLIEAKRVELRLLEEELFNLEEGPRLEAIAQIRNIMRAHDLTLADFSVRTRRKSK